MIYVQPKICFTAIKSIEEALSPFSTAESKSFAANVKVHLRVVIAQLVETGPRSSPSSLPPQPITRPLRATGIDHSPTHLRQNNLKGLA